MEFRMKYYIPMVVLLGLFVSGGVRAAYAESPVEVKGGRISVHADGIPLGELLTAVGALTEVQFGLDKSLAEERVFVDFEGLPLPQGIKKIIHPFNCAEIYDDTGRLCKVVILGRGKGQGVRLIRERGKNAPESHPSDTVLSAPMGRSGASVETKVPTLVKKPGHNVSTPQGRSKSGDGREKPQDREMAGPSLDTPYVVDGPPLNQAMAKDNPPPEGKSSDNPPPPDSVNPAMDGPPLDREYPIDGPPGWKN
jgi:hypothetical protein